MSQEQRGADVPDPRTDVDRRLVSAPADEGYQAPRPSGRKVRWWGLALLVSLAVWAGLGYAVVQLLR